MKNIRFIISFILKFKWMAVLYHYFILKLYKISYLEFPSINGRIKLICKGTISLGSGLKINSGKKYNPIGGDTTLRFITAKKNAILKIGNNVGISNSTIVCWNSVTIEDDVLIGGSCKIYDTDFHATTQTERIAAFKTYTLDEKAKTAPIIIKKGAWIGGHCIILKGLSIGENSIIGAGSVVTKSIPDNEIWAGNPIRFINKIK
jgi:acetyltransferase-like isoleucine patch superfamily enzyme